MNRFRADLHTHTFLSPCGDIGMVPSFIVETALRKGYDIIGITDHNTTVQAREIRRMVGDGEPYILCGAEITTREEAHCLAFADSEESLDALQRFLDDNLPQVPNDEEMFGYQLAVNADEEAPNAPIRFLLHRGPCVNTSGQPPDGLPVKRSMSSNASGKRSRSNRTAVRCPGDFRPLRPGAAAGAQPLPAEAQSVIYPLVGCPLPRRLLPCRHIFQYAMPFLR